MLKIAKFVVTAFAGAISNIPPGWLLCDGTHGTPDLRDKFIIATGPTFSVRDEGGQETHTHTSTTIGHNHRIPIDANLFSPGVYSRFTATTLDDLTTDPSSNLPYYYALAYIMYGGP